MIFAVDFDGVISLAGWPEVGEPNTKLIDFLIRRKNKGDKLILWTCRCGDKLDDAVRFCRYMGLEFDGINENLESTIEFMGGDSRKIFADYYIDDRNMVIYDNHLYFVEKSPNGKDEIVKACIDTDIYNYAKYDEVLMKRLYDMMDDETPNEMANMGSSNTVHKVSTNPKVLTDYSMDPIYQACENNEKIEED